MESLESSRQITEPIVDESFRGRRRSCFCFPCFDRSPSPTTTWWKSQTAESGNSLWKRGVGAVMKIREWSELVAGPRWKTFIRRFNRNRSGNKHVNFQYDPLSYAMNFDEGPGQSGDLMSEVDYHGSRNFSSRFANADAAKDISPTVV